jgi:thiol-disulfide isomerase/thioredoxin
MKTFNIFAAAAIILLAGCATHRQTAQTTSCPAPAVAPASAEADAAWKQVQQAAVLPSPPQEWNQTPPTREQVQQFYKQVSDVATAAVEKVRAFYTQFPDSTNALAARNLECSLLKTAFLQGGGSQSAYDALAKAQDALLQDPKLSDDDRFKLRLEIAERKRVNPGLNDAASNAAYEEALRGVIKDYPHRDEPYDRLLNEAALSSDDKARSVANEMLAGPVSDSIKDKARAILHRLDAVGKPLDIKFTAVDGRTVDLSSVKGKVVLVDFWATWCGPCVGEVPHVKETYDKFHPKGFDVVGISFDGSESALRHFIQTHDMPWPQYYDGKVWQNKFGTQFAIEGIPTMWLVDKNGNLRDTDARDGLQDKVEKLLAE